MNVGKYFNPSKKVDFQLYINDILIQSGYIKLLDIEFINDDIWRYNIALFGELGNFINLLDNKTLKDVLQSYKNNYIQFAPTFPSSDYDLPKLYTLDNLFRSRISSDRSNHNINNLYTDDFTIDPFLISSGSNYPNTYIDLIDAENGLYNDGKKIKYIDGDFDLPIPYTEQQMCLKNEVRQRLGFYNDKLIADIIKELGYELDNINGDWINKSNPYWFNTITTTNTPDKISNDWEITASGYFDRLKIETSGTYKYYTISNFIESINNDDGVDIGLGIETEYSYGPNDNNYQVNMKPMVIGDIYPNKFISEFKIISANGTFKAGSSGIARGVWVPITTPLENIMFRIQQIIIVGDVNTNNQKSYINKELILTNKYYESNESNMYYFRFIITPYNENGRLEIQSTDSQLWISVDDYFNNNNLIKIDKNPYFTNQNYSIIYRIQKSDKTHNAVTNGFNSMSMGGIDLYFDDRYNSFEYKLNSFNEVEQGSKLRYWDLLPDFKVQDYLLSYIKVFGLYLDIDNDAKKIKILTKNEFYGDENIIDWSEKLCLDRDITINPLSFDKKFIRLSYKDSDNYLSKSYKNKYNINYGQMLLNTGYDFNNETYNLFDDIVWSDYISVAQKRDIYGVNNYQKVIPHLYNDELIKSKRSDKYYLIFASPPLIDTYIIGKIPSVKTTGVVSNWEYDGEMINFGWFNEGVKNLYTGQVTMPVYNLWTQKIYISPIGQFGISYDKNNFKYGPLGKESSSGHLYNPTTQYYPDPYNIQYSLDFARPFEIYHNIEYTEGTTIYDRLFKSFLEDRYNVNTKVMTAYFYLNDIDFNNFKFNNFIYVKNKLWVVNKIIDYDVIKNDPVKIELISVNDITNYSNGQNMDIIIGDKK